MSCAVLLNRKPPRETTISNNKSLQTTTPAVLENRRLRTQILGNFTEKFKRVMLNREI